MKRLLTKILFIGTIIVPLAVVGMLIQGSHLAVSPTEAKKMPTFDEVIDDNAGEMLKDGRQIFRFDTFGD